MSELRIGVDLGGTKIEAVVLRLHGENRYEELARRRIPTPKQEGYDAILGACATLVTGVAEAAGLGRLPRVGVGMPGSITRAGLVKNSNTTVLNGRPFRQDLARRLGELAGQPVDIAFDNDANCFALAEARLGAARSAGPGITFGAILGTGCGGGIVVRNASGELWPWDGLQGIGGEWGHTVLHTDSDRACYCGQRGCVETYLAGPAVEADYARRAGTELPLAEIARRRREDAHAAAAIEGLLDAFGRAVANLVNVLDPAVLVLGGGVSNLDLLYDEGVERVRFYVFNDVLETPIRRHELGDSAGVIGAALL